MPEKMTREEAVIAMAIKKAREVKSALHESTQIMPYDYEAEVVKVKRPKAQKADKITNQTQKKEGYGLAGETLKKEDNSKDKTLRMERIILNYGKTLFGLKKSLEAFHGIIENDMKAAYFSKEEILDRYMRFIKEDIEKIEKALRD